MQEIREIEVAKIVMGKRVRPVSPASVRKVALSFEAKGQIDPIKVRSTNAAAKPWTLIDGAHRLTAAKELGWDTIRAEVLKVDAKEAQAIEIETNIAQADLNLIDKAAMVARKIEIMEEELGPLEHGGNRQDGNNAVLTWEHIETATGLSERSIRRLQDIHRLIGSKAKDVLRETPVANNQAKLLKLARMEPDKEAMAVSLLANGVEIGEAISQAEGGKPKKQPHHEQMFDGLVAAWSKAPERSRLRFLELVGEEIDTLRAKAAPPS